MRMKVTLGRTVAVVVALAAVAGVAAALRDDPITVDVAVVRHAAIRVAIRAEGRTRVRDRYLVTSPTPGRLVRLTLREGGRVRAGDVVALVAPALVDEPSAEQARAQLSMAQAADAAALVRLRTGEAAAAQARRDAGRARQLADAGALSSKALEDAMLVARIRDDEVRALAAQRDIARAEVRRARAALLYTESAAARVATRPVRADADGRILRTFDVSERPVAAGTPLMEIGDLTRLEIVADVLSSDAARIRPGMAAAIDGWGEEGALAGRVRLVEPAATTRISALGVEEQRVNVLIDAPAPGGLGDGYRVDVTITLDERPFVLALPAGALVRDDSGWAAYTIEEGRARRAGLTLGAVGEADAEVVKGLQPGSRVIVFPSDLIREGVRVRPRS